MTQFDDIPVVFRQALDGFVESFSSFLVQDVKVGDIGLVFNLHLVFLFVARSGLAEGHHGESFLAQEIDACIGSDPVQPGREGKAELEGGQGLESLDERILCQVIDVVFVLDHLPDKGEYQLVILILKVPERTVVAGENLLYVLEVNGIHLLGIIILILILNQEKSTFQF